MTGWSEPDADPIGDLTAWSESIAAQSGYHVTKMTLSSSQMEQYERFLIWFEETERRLAVVPRRRVVTRVVLARQLYGPWRKRSRALRAITRPYRNWRRERRVDGEW